MSRREGNEGRKCNYRVSLGERFANWEEEAEQRAFPSVKLHQVSSFS